VKQVRLGVKLGGSSGKGIGRSLSPEHIWWGGRNHKKEIIERTQAQRGEDLAMSSEKQKTKGGRGKGEREGSGKIDEIVQVGKEKRWRGGKKQAISLS